MSKTVNLRVELTVKDDANEDAIAADLMEFLLEDHDPELNGDVESIDNVVAL